MADYRKYLLFAVGIKFYLTFFLLTYLDIGLAPDEAQYWTWSRELDWGYYSKPPGIAWQIFLGTSLWGDSVFGIRFFSLVFSSLFIPLTYRLFRAGKISRYNSFAASLLFAATPLSFFLSFAATTDVGYLFFWILALTEMGRGARARSGWIGVWIACGALFKWAIYWLLLPLFLMRYFFPPFRGTTKAFFLSLLGLAPSIYWNANHEFATFRHVLGNMMGKGGHATGSEANFFEFFSGQMLLISPFIFILLLFALFKAAKNYRNLNPSLKLYLVLSLFLFCSFLGASAIQKMQVNWLSHLYPAAFIFLGWHFRERLQLVAGTFSLALILFTLAIPSLQQDGSYIPYSLNPFRHSLGWITLEKELNLSGYNPKEDFLFGDKYQTASLLSFYSSGKRRAYFLNLGGTRKNQFDFWPGMDQEKGKTGFFVWIEANLTSERQVEEAKRHYQKALKPFFQKIEVVRAVPLFSTREGVKKIAVIFKGTDYNGKMIQSPEKY